MNKSFTCEQYWDLATATRSLSMGWDWDTRGETAWMTAVNLGYGLIPGTQKKDDHSLMQFNKSRKQCWAGTRRADCQPLMQFQAL